MHGSVNILQNGMEHCNSERKSNLRRDLKNLLTSNIQLQSAQRAMSVEINEGTIDGELKSRVRLGQCIWVEIKWSGQMKYGEKEIDIMIRALLGPQMKWKRERKSRERKKTNVWARYMEFQPRFLWFCFFIIS